jgi:hypothetical protein
MRRSNNGANWTVQDGQIAIEVAERMLEEYPEPHEWNPDEPEFYETFEIIDLDAFRAGIETLKEEYV